MKIFYCRYIFLLICIRLLNDSGIRIFINMLISCCFGNEWIWIDIGIRIYRELFDVFFVFYFVSLYILE